MECFNYWKKISSCPFVINCSTYPQSLATIDLFAFSRVVNKRNHSECSLLRSAFFFSIIDWIMLCLISITFPSYCWMEYYWMESLHKCTTICIFVYQLKDICVLSNFDNYEYSCYKHLCACFCMSISFHFSLVNTKESIVLSYGEGLFNLGNQVWNLSKVAVPFCISTSILWEL